MRRNENKVEKDQVESYDERKGMSIDVAERWLAPVIISY